MSGLDRERIVEAAVEILDRDGLAGLTTRRLAERLGVKSPSLYWHLRDREELLGLLSDRIVAEARWPRPSASWRSTAEGLMREYLRCLLAHRDSARVVAGRPPLGPNRLRGAEMLMKALLAAGLTDQEAIDAGLLLTTYVVGFALEKQAADAAAWVSQPADVDRYPTLARLASALPPAGWARFEEGMSLILDGLQSRMPGTGPRRGKWREGGRKVRGR